MTGFIGRQAELALLGKRLAHVTASGEGRAVALRGRWQAGKSRLVQEVCDRSGVPYLYVTAVKGASPAQAVDDFLRELRSSSLPDKPELVPAHGGGDWGEALRALAAALPSRPSIVVLDELPWLSEQDKSFDGALQTAWDRLLSRRPVLLLLLGSDLHMMERLTAYDRPFFGRADNLVLGPLNPAEVGGALGLDDADALDAHLVTGGLPGIVRAWPHGTPAPGFLHAECADPASPVFSVPESSLASEFPAPDQSRRVLEAVGSGDRTHANIAASAGGHDSPLPSGALSPILRRLTHDKRVLTMTEPLSVKPGKPALYHVADSNLRLYLAMTRAAQEQARRGREDAARRLVERRWSSWRGRAVEPLIRESLLLAALDGKLPDDTYGDVEAVGGWWNRRFDPELDLVGADRAPVARRIAFVGSVKWHDTPATRAHAEELAAAAPQVPGFQPGRTGLVLATRQGTAGDVSASGVSLVWQPHDVVGAWRDSRTRMGA
ncbi:AAA family ATPase [Streptomyces sp. NPDC046821]|uniref:ATP-binding protein n=1 Tax=Streptomyces sp. NPDC046821 TaxID=3154702 RepID=UPI0033D0E35F